MIALIKSEIFLLAASAAGLMVFFLCANRGITRELGFRLFALLFYCITIAFLSPNYNVFYVAALLIVPIFAQRRAEIAPVYLFALMTLPQVTTPFAIGSTYLISLHPIATLTIGAAMTTVVRSQGGKISWSLYASAICLFFLVTVVPSGRLGSATAVARVALESALTMLFPYYILSNSVRTLDDVRLAFVGIVAAGASLATLAIYESRTSWPMYRVIYENFGIPLSADANVKMRGGFLRSAGPYPEPLSFAYWLALSALATFASRWMFRSKIHYIAVVALAFLGFLAPQSRGTLLALAVALVVFHLVLGRVRAVATTCVVLAASGLLLYAAALSVPRVGSILGINSSGIVVRDYREALFERGMEEARKNYWLGTDLETVKYQLSDLYQGEGIIDFVNSYLYILLISGLVGLSLFASALLGPVWALWRKRLTVPVEARTQLAYVASALCCMAVALAFTSIATRSMMGISIMLSLGATLVHAVPAARRPARSVRQDVASARLATR